MSSAKKKYSVSIEDINPKHKNSFPDSSTCFIGISLGNPKFDIKYIPSILNWVSANFKECVIVIVDYIYRYNLMVEKGYDEESATKIALDLGKNTKAMFEIIKPNDAFKIYQWQDKEISPPKGYKENFFSSIVTNPLIVEDIEKDVSSYLDRKNIIIDKNSDVFKYSFMYIIEELMFVNYRIECNNHYSVYPGTQLQIMKNFSNKKYISITDLALNNLVCIDLKIKK